MWVSLKHGLVGYFSVVVQEINVTHPSRPLLLSGLLYEPWVLLDIFTLTDDARLAGKVSSPKLGDLKAREYYFLCHKQTGIYFLVAEEGQVDITTWCRSKMASSSCAGEGPKTAGRGGRNSSSYRRDRDRYSSSSLCRFRLSHSTTTDA